MQEFEFTLLLSGIRDFSEADVDALFAAGCDDATVAQRHGRVFLTFARQAENFSAAIVSAVQDVERAGTGASVLRVDQGDLVTQAEIARRMARTRQAVGQYISGQRGPGGFPAAACNIAEGQPLWSWCEVSTWLAKNGLMEAKVGPTAQEVTIVNDILELRHLSQVAPGVTRQLLDDFGFDFWTAGPRAST